jgi:hypothetical protein
MKVRLTHVEQESSELEKRIKEQQAAMHTKLGKIVRLRNIAEE